MVQEELQQLTHQLDHSDSLYVRQPGEESISPGPSGPIQLKNRLKSLKNEFTDLIGELRRRSSIVEGMTLSFEVSSRSFCFRKFQLWLLSTSTILSNSSWIIVFGTFLADYFLKNLVNIRITDVIEKIVHLIGYAKWIHLNTKYIQYRYRVLERLDNW